MGYLLDTHIVLWIAEGSAIDDPVLGPILEASDPRALTVSALSFWELAIKSARHDFAIDLAKLKHAVVAIGYPIIPFTTDHALAVQGLPQIHRDPFDRGLIAQAMAEDLTLLTRDRIIPRYPVKTLSV